MARLQDVVARDLRVLFVAINPATPSAEVGQHFATPTNMFWRLLHTSGLTPRLFAPAEANQLLDVGLGLVSLVDRPTAAAASLRTEEMRAGARLLAVKIRRLRPRTIALLGLTLLPYVLPDESGPGLKRGRFEGTRVFVLPNPSGRNRSYPGFAPKLRWYRALAKSVHRLGA